jgi:hypothetical protein
MYLWIICGLIGGAAPSLINLAGHLTTNYDGVGLPGPGYLVGVSIYAVIGLVAAAIFANRTAIEAIKVGIFAPALLLSFLNGASSVATSTEAKVSWLLGTSAYAQDTAAPDTAVGDTKNLFLSIDGIADGKILDTQVAPTLQYLSKDGSLKSLPLVVGDTTSVEVPADLGSATIKLGETLKEFQLPPSNAFVDVTVESATSSFNQQLLFALTGNATASADSLGVAVKPLSPN